MKLDYDDVLSELETPKLDLSRPELAGVMARYQTSPKVKSPIAVSGTALIVGADATTECELRIELEAHGWETCSCPGPSIVSRCPLFVGGTCKLRENADRAIVFVDTTKVATTGVLPKLRCAADRSSPYVLVLEKSIQGRKDRTGGTVIGSRRGVSAIADAVDHVGV